MIALTTLLGSALLSVSGVQEQPPLPPPMEQSTTDCDLIVYASDHLVCDDPELLDLNNRLRISTQAWPDDDKDLLETSTEWLRRRSFCAFEAEHRTCLVEAYTDRLEEAEAMALLSNKMEKYRCGAPISKIVWIEHSAAAQLVLRDVSTGTTIGISASASRFTTWHPMLSYRQNGEAFEFETSLDVKFKCKKSR